MSGDLVELGSIAEFINGVAFKPVDWSEQGLRIIRIQNLTQSDSNYNRTTRSVPPKMHVYPGDLLVSWSASLGVYIWDSLDTALLNQHIFRVLPDEKLVDKQYLKHCLVHALTDMQRHLHGATMQHINRGEFLSIKIYLPPLPEQKRIAAILDKADELRAKRRAAIAKLDELGQAIFLEMFGDPIKNSQGLPLQPLSSLGSLDRGVSKHRPRNDPELLNGPYPLIQTGDVANCDGYIKHYSNTYSESGLKQSKMWPVGTLCITIAANIAKTGILQFDACFPDSVVGFTAEKQATTEYVRIWLSFLQASLEERAPESAQKNINLEILRNLMIPVPSMMMQQDFANRIAFLEKIKSSQQTSLAQLDALFSSLQAQAFQGEL